MATMCLRGAPSRAQCEWPVSAQSLRSVHGCYKSVYQKPVVDDRKLGAISYFRWGSYPSLSGSERARSHDVTSDHFLMSRIRAIGRMQFARTGTVQLVSIFQRIEIHVWHLSRGQRSSKRRSGRWAMVCSQHKSLIKMKQIQQVYELVGSLCSLEDREPVVEPSSTWEARTTF